ncbi:MAG: amino acid racemase [Opitutales bacterium]|nr:amino acid racemase [Opitutales bacterium]
MVIGILGGMGSFATLEIFRRYLEKFPAVKEWERPRIVIDNNCTMPSRVLAALENKDRERLVREMASSLKTLVQAGCSHIFLACNTSHIFLDEVLKIVPEASGKVINIIECLAKSLAKKKKDNLLLLATEGTIQTHIYQNIFSRYGLTLTEPGEELFPKMRAMIESVKQNTLGIEDFNILKNIIFKINRGGGNSWLHRIAGCLFKIQTGNRCAWF